MVNSNRTPHFFQVIMPAALQQGKLEVPTSFLRKYGRQSFGGRNSVPLVMPNADSWIVGVEISARDRKVMLGQGWSEFMNHYSLGVGSFVLFRFEPLYSVFAVLIFDQSSMEINYPPKPAAAAAPIATARGHPVRIKEESEFESSDDGDDEDDEEDTEDDDEDDEDNEDNEEDTEDDDEDDEDTEDDDEDEDDFLTEAGTQANPIVIDYEARTHLQKLRSNLLKSMPLRKSFIGNSGNACFRLRIQPSYLQRKSRVTLPLKFALKNNLNKKLEAELRMVGYGKTWPLGIYYRVTPKERRAELSNAGWHHFCREVGIRVGDHCQFELTSRLPNKVFFTMSIIGLAN